MMSRSANARLVMSKFVIDFRIFLLQITANITNKLPKIPITPITKNRIVRYITVVSLVASTSTTSSYSLSIVPLTSPMYPDNTCLNLELLASNDMTSISNELLLFARIQKIILFQNSYSSTNHCLSNIYI